MTNGAQAETWADHYIAVHLALIIHADGWLGRAAAEPLNGS
jgi:hypothetical protein